MISPEKLKDKRWLAQYTPEEKELLKNYFAFAGGCFAKPLSDEEYLAKVEAKLKSLNIYQRAIRKIGLDEEEIQEIPPKEFGNFLFTSDAVSGPSGIYTSKYQVSWFFFSATQIYFYQYTLDMLSQSAKESCEEYFYKDITSFSTNEDTTEYNYVAMKGCPKKPVNTKGTRTVSSLKVVVPGDKFEIAAKAGEDLETKVQAMKQKLREKKNS